jgi:hypothetical protein
LAGLKAPAALFPRCFISKDLARLATDFCNKICHEQTLGPLF